jgi:hypothetical protein
MPRKYLAGTFHGKPHYRWRKLYKGEWYSVKCHELGLPREMWTKEGSYKAANGWWRAKLVELNALDPVSAAFHRVVEAVPVERLAEMIRQGKEAARIMEALPVAPGPVDGATVDEFLRMNNGEPLDDALRLSLLGKVGSTLGDAPGERTIGAQLDRYLAEKKDKSDKGIIKVGTYGIIFERLRNFREWAGQTTPLDSINRDWWEKWYSFCAGKMAERDRDEDAGWSGDYACGIFNAAKAFVNWLWESGVIESLPRSFNKKGAYKFERPEPVKQRFEQSEIELILKEAPGQLRLHLLLMLNCGMTQKDISDLRQTQILLKNGKGYIVRRRSKTERNKKTPRVRYLLWGVTLRELLKWRSTDPTYALLNRHGKPWVREWIREDKRRGKADGIRSNFKHLQRRLKITKSLRVFRKTSATRLNKSDRHSRLVYLFLGHRAPDIARRHYADAPDLSKAIRWLGKTYKLA